MIAKKIIDTGERGVSFAKEISELAVLAGHGEKADFGAAAVG